MSYPEHFDWEPPDPPVDEPVTIRCTNPDCFMFEEYQDEPSREVFGGQWHPTTESEYQGEYPHGGMVAFYTDDAFTCPECGEEGEEVS